MRFNFNALQQYATKLAAPVSRKFMYVLGLACFAVPVLAQAATGDVSSGATFWETYGASLINGGVAFMFAKTLLGHFVSQNKALLKIITVTIPAINDEVRRAVDEGMDSKLDTILHEIRRVESEIKDHTSTDK